MEEEKKDNRAGSLAGKIALVTGGGRGIGRAVALALAGEGAAVLVNYNGSRDRAQAVAAEIERNGGRAEAVGCDVSDFASCAKMVEDIIGRYGRVDILVNNAGVTRDNLILRMTEEEYDKVLDTNLKGAFNTIRHLSRYFLKQRCGKVINISSVSGVMGNAGQANYAASKGAGGEGSLRQCGGSRLYPHGYDGGASRKGAGRADEHDPHGKGGQAGGCRRNGGISGRKRF